MFLLVPAHPVIKGHKMAAVVVVRMRDIMCDIIIMPLHVMCLVSLQL